MQTIDQSVTSFKQKKSSLEVTITKIAQFTVEDSNNKDAEVKEVDSENRISPPLQHPAILETNKIVMNQEKTNKDLTELCTSSG